MMTTRRRLQLSETVQPYNANMKTSVVMSLLLVAAAYGADLPVREVILYKHGVGFFERAGQLRAGEAARLDFKAAEMNDVLKSLTIEEKNGGKVTGIRYDSSDSLERKLQDFPFRIGESKPLSALLDQLKGARVEIKFGSETVGGILLGARTVPASDKQPERQQATLLLDSGAVRDFDLSAAADVRFTEPELQKQIAAYLSAVANSRSREKRSVYIDSATDKIRDLIASYVVPTPVWKSSYRLIFGENAEPTLEGWAIVDNTSGEDWTNVRLALVSGRPISFISNLYEPKYVQRPTAELPEDRAQGPVVYGGAIQDQKQKAMNMPAAPAPAAMAMRARTMGSVAQSTVVAMERDEMTSSIVAATQGAELGELFEYRFSTPVTVRKNESGMLPFIQQKISARKLLIYSDGSSPNPLNAAELNNTTGKTLDGGPITVFDGGAYGGEALVETLKAGDKRLISYALDLGTRVTTKLGADKEIIREFHLNRGVLTTRTAAQETKTYTIRNVDAKPKTLIIEHPVRPQYKLVSLKPSETTANAYRFEVKLGPKATEEFPVTEERVFDTTYAITNLTPDVLMSYVQNKALSDAGRKQLDRILQQKRQIADVDAAIATASTQVNEVTQDQERIRQNINSLNRVSGQQDQVQNYARQLAAQETQLAALRDQLSQLRKKKAALETELNHLLESMSF